MVLNHRIQIEDEVCMQSLYDQIIRRKSFHRFVKPFSNLTAEQLAQIELYFSIVEPLVEGIKTLLRIVPINQTTCRQGEYALLLYSEHKEGYLQNIGYIGEQLDLYLAKEHIGACWYGLGRPKVREYEGLRFVCMLCIANQDGDCFRTRETKLNRLEIQQIWEGEDPYNLAPVVRLAPSACNTQPWLVKQQGDVLLVYRAFRKRGIIPPSLVPYYQSIDIGIFLLFLELTLKEKGLKFTKTLASEVIRSEKMVLTATYTLHR